MSYPEWGVGNFGDNPFFIQQMHDWFMKNEGSIAYAAYFDVDERGPPRSRRRVSELQRCSESCSAAYLRSSSFTRINPVH